MGAFKDLTKNRYGMLIVNSRSHSVKSHGWYWNVVCDCGVEKVVRGSALVNGDTRSCGNHKSELSPKTHGMSKTPTYFAWQRMKRRCTEDSTSLDYPHYFARGIVVCDRWKDSFENFYADMGEIPEGHSLERIDVNKIYEPSNCKWLPEEEENRNKTTNRRIEYNGETKILEDWARQYNMSSGALGYRLDSGMPFEEAVTKDVAERTMKHMYKGEERDTTYLESIANVPNKTITERIRRGWTVEAAVETPLDTVRKSANLEWEGKTWSLVGLAKHLGMSHQTLYARIHTHGMTLEEAITKPLKTSGRKKKIVE